jgi:hypothetical protein
VCEKYIYQSELACIAAAVATGHPWAVVVLQRGQVEVDTIAIANQEAEFSRPEQTAKVFDDLVYQLMMEQMAEDAAEVEVGQAAEGTTEEAQEMELEMELD